MRVKLRLYRLLQLLIVLLAVVSYFYYQPVTAQDDSPVIVVATFSVLKDITRQVGGDAVEVSALVRRDRDPHHFEPSSNDLKRLAQADVLVSNGLGLEPWLSSLLKTSEFAGEHIIASDGVAPIEGESVDPHAWHDLRNGMIYAENISSGLAAIDAQSNAYYQQRLDAYLDQAEKLHKELRDAFEALPEEHRNVMTANGAFQYFGEAYEVNFIVTPALSSKAEPSSDDVAAIAEKAAQYEKIAIFSDRATNPKLIDKLAATTGMPVSGPLFAESLGPEGGPADTYLGMVRWNAGQFVTALQD